MENERSTFEPTWRDVSDYVRPRRTRFFVADANKGDRRNEKILDTTGTLASRTLRSGMMSGVTSPARPWFRLTTSNPVLAERGDLKNWLYNTTNTLTTLYLRSNLYNVLPTVYGDMGDFATGCMMVERDEKNVFHFRSFPAGSYAIGVDDKNRVNKFMREFRMTVHQVVMRFAYDEKTGKYDFEKVSKKVEHAFKNGQTEQWIDVTHFIYPNPDYKPGAKFPEFQKYASCYYESGTQLEHERRNDVFLQSSGTSYFKVFSPRWEVTGEDIYGTDCPGITAYGDVRQLQKGESKGLQGIEKQVSPPTIGSSTLRQSAVSTLPGDMTYADGDALSSLKPIYQVNFDLNALENKQQQVRQRISRAYYEDLFLMLAQSDRRQITAREIQERHEEKLLALGPVLEQLNQDLLDPLIDVTFEMAFEEGLIQPPPDDLQGEELKVEYISIMAQAQKLVGLSGIERFTNYIGGVANADPRILDKINGDQLVDVYGDLTSIPPGIVRSDEEVANIRQQRAQAEQRQAQLEQQAMEAQTAKTLSDTEVGDEQNALQALANAGDLVGG